LTLLTAAEWVGVAFLLSMITLSSWGQQFWSNVQKRLQPTGETVVTKQGICQKYVVPKQPPNSPEDEVPLGIICNAMDILYVLEPFHVTDSTLMSAVRHSLVILLNSIKEFTPHNHRNGWKLQNFHEHLHLPMDVYLFGSPQNYDNSPSEHGLIETAKCPADHAQKS